MYLEIGTTRLGQSRMIESRIKGSGLVRFTILRLNESRERTVEGMWNIISGFKFVPGAFLAPSFQRQNVEPIFAFPPSEAKH